jgi:F-type H+-transporting ATPase subunit epsilon
MEQLNVNIVSPSGQLVANKKVSVLTVPSVDGEINILPGHIDLVCLLGKGLLKLDDDISYIIYKGFMEVVSGQNVVIAAERTTLVSDLNKQNLLQSIKATEEKLLKEYLDDATFQETYDFYQDRLAELKAFN